MLLKKWKIVLSGMRRKEGVGWHNYWRKRISSRIVLMVKLKKYIRLCILSLSITLITSGCDEQFQKDSGFLKGVISIGPLCPVEKDPPDPDCLPTYETYKAYPVTIWTSDGRRKIAQLNPALDGSYNLELNPGKYSVILGTGQNIVVSSNLPAEVEIRSQAETILNIDIDTGIR